MNLNLLELDFGVENKEKTALKMRKFSKAHQKIFYNSRSI